MGSTYTRVGTFIRLHSRFGLLNLCEILADEIIQEEIFSQSKASRHDDQSQFASSRGSLRP